MVVAVAECGGPECSGPCRSGLWTGLRLGKGDVRTVRELFMLLDAACGCEWMQPQQTDPRELTLGRRTVADADRRSL